MKIRVLAERDLDVFRNWSNEVDLSYIVQPFVLEDCLTIDNNLIINNANLIKMPENLEVFGSLILTGNSLPELSSKITIHGNLNITDSCIKKIDKNVAITGSIYAKNSLLKSLPDNFSINDWLYISNCKDFVFPKNLSVAGIVADGVDIKELPTDFRTISLRGSGIVDEVINDWIARNKELGVEISIRENDSFVSYVQIEQNNTRKYKK